MLRNRLPFVLVICAFLLTLGSLSPAFAAESTDYVVMFDESNFDIDEARASLEASGGTIINDYLEEIGIAIVRTNTLNFVGAASSTHGLSTIAENVQINFGENVVTPAHAYSLADLTDSPYGNIATPSLANLPNADLNPGGVTDPTLAAAYAPLQWNMRVMETERAWAEGHLGDPNVTVAVLDSGVDWTHPEVAGTIDTDRSRSFVPEEEALIQELFPGAFPFADLHFHGTFHAAIIACRSLVTACVAPNTTIVGIKVLDQTLSGNAAAMVNGIMYAARIKVDVLAITFAKKLDRSIPEERQAFQAIRRALLHAWDRGVFVAADGGADVFIGGVDADEDGAQAFFPAQGTRQNVTVSSVGKDNLTANFSNWGSSLIVAAGPGGHFAGGAGDEPGNHVLSPCSRFSTLIPSCQTPTDEDPVRWVFIIGPSVASAHVAGVAALVDSTRGGAIHGSWLRSRLLRNSDDLGEPGFDNRYGRGRINAYKAVTLP